MLNFPFSLNLPQNAQANFSNPHFLLRLQAFQDMVNPAEYPVVKHQKLESSEAAVILDPDVFFKKEADFMGEDFSLTNQATEDSSAMSPSRDCVLSSFSEILTPDQSPTELERKSSQSVLGQEEEEEIKTPHQLTEVIRTKLTGENVGLISMIEKILQGQVTSTAEMVGLTPIEECVADAILQKKDFTNQKNKKTKGKKREEEKQKFFFKGVLKYTEAKFFGTDTTQKKRTKKKQLKREAYYEHYWGDVAKDQKVDLSNFFHPNKKLAQSKTTAQITSAHNPGLKSLNSTYIDLILSSETFKADTLDYLDNVFMKEARTSRCQKISKLFSKLCSLAIEAKNKNGHLPINKQLEAVKVKIYEYLVVNPKSKLPWADSELQEARDFAYGTILRQSSKSGKTSF